MAYPFVPSPNSTRTRGRAVDVVVVHTMEIREREGAAAACARWFARADAQVSAHYCVDDEAIIRCVPEKDIAWHARGGNSSSIGIELAGYARQSADEWADAYSTAVLERAAGLTADVCRRNSIPIRWLDPTDLIARGRGIAGHVDVSNAFRKSDHWDPGPAFPKERFLALVLSSGLREISRRRMWAPPPDRALTSDP